MFSTSIPYSIDISITDSIICSGHADGGLKLWSVRDHKIIKEIKDLHDEIITSVTYATDGN
jgi:WD40 repeat protein